MMLGKTSLKMVSQEVVQTEFSVVHGLTRMHGLTRNEDTHFTNLLWDRSTSVMDLITNLSHRQPLFSRYTFSMDDLFITLCHVLWYVNSETRLTETSWRCVKIQREAKEIKMRSPFANVLSHSIKHIKQKVVSFNLVLIKTTGPTILDVI